jgi:hypothetical protein
MEKICILYLQAGEQQANRPLASMGFNHLKSARLLDKPYLNNGVGLGNSEVFKIICMSLNVIFVREISYQGSIKALPQKWGRAWFFSFHGISSLLGECRKWHANCLPI